MTLTIDTNKAIITNPDTAALFVTLTDGRLVAVTKADFVSDDETVLVDVVHEASVNGIMGCTEAVTVDGGQLAALAAFGPHSPLPSQDVDAMMAWGR